MVKDRWLKTTRYSFLPTVANDHISAVIDTEKLYRVLDDSVAGGFVLFTGEQKIGMEFECFCDSEDGVEQVILVVVYSLCVFHRIDNQAITRREKEKLNNYLLDISTE